MPVGELTRGFLRGVVVLIDVPPPPVSESVTRLFPAAKPGGEPMDVLQNVGGYPRRYPAPICPEQIPLPPPKA